MTDYRGQNDRTDGSVITASLRGWKKLSVWANTAAFRTLAPLLIQSPCQQLSFMVWFGGKVVSFSTDFFYIFNLLKTQRMHFTNSLRPPNQESSLWFLLRTTVKLLFCTLPRKYWSLSCYGLLDLNSFEKFCKNQLGILNILRLHLVNTKP